MIFVADEIPDELRNVVEFLNSQMDRTEVLAIEVKQYVSSDNPPLRTLVPSVIGLTAEARTKKGGGSRWDHDRFFAALEKSSPTDVEIAERLYKFAGVVSGQTILWGTGTDSGSFTAKLRVGREIFSLFSVYTTAHFTMNIGWNADRLQRLNLPDFDSEYRERFSALIGRDITPDAWRGYYGKTELSLLSDDVTEQRFESLIRDLANGLKEAIPTVEGGSSA